MATAVDPQNSEDEERHPDDIPLEGTVFTPRQVRLLKVVVVVLGLLLLAALGVLIWGLVHQASKAVTKPQHAAPVAAAPAAKPHSIALEATKHGIPHVLDIPGDADVVSMSLDGNRLALHVRSRTKDEIVVMDLITGKVVSRLNIRESAEE